MDGTKTEREQGSGRVVKKLGERFNPLDLPLRQHGGSLKMYEFDLSLEREAEIPPISFLIFFPREDVKYKAFTPDDPNKGYLVTAEDFDENERAEKLKSFPEMNQPNMFQIKGDWKALIKSGIAEEEFKSFYYLKNEYLPIFLRLRAHVFFPGSDPGTQPDDPNYRPALSYEAGVNLYHLMRTGDDVLFLDFYPLDTGPLRRDTKNFPEKFSEGHGIQLPHDPKFLRKMEVEFILLPEEKPQI